MTDRDIVWRLGGLLALAAAEGTSLLHQSVLAAHINGPASSLEFVFGLCSFVLASLGVLLLIQGAKLHDSWVRHCKARQDARSAERASEIDAQNDQAWIGTISADPRALAGGRVAIAVFLADRASRANAAGRAKTSHPKETRRQGIPRDRTQPTFRNPHLPFARRGRDRGSL